VESVAAALLVADLKLVKGFQDEDGDGMEVENCMGGLGVWSCEGALGGEEDVQEELGFLVGVVGGKEDFFAHKAGEGDFGRGLIGRGLVGDFVVWEFPGYGFRLVVAVVVIVGDGDDRVVGTVKSRYRSSRMCIFVGRCLL
jgi:hypothetical protein